MALALCVLLSVTSAQSGITAALTFPPPFPGGEHKPGDRPQQAWGSAAGQEHIVGASKNRTVPKSLRSRYPLHAEKPAPKPKPNTAKVVDPPASAQPRGFDPEASRELPDARRAGQRTFANADGTHTTEFSLAAPEQAPPSDGPDAAPPVETVNAGSAMVVRGNSTVSGSNELLVGNEGGTSAASYLKFDAVADRLRNHTVYGVQLQIVNFDSASCRPRPVTVHEVTQSWTTGGDYRYPGPSVGSALANRSFAYGHIPVGQSRSDCPAAAALIDLGNAGRKTVQGWADGSRANNGLSLRAPVGDSSAWKKFAGTGTANAPKLYVTHTAYNAGYAIPNPVPTPPVLQNQDGKVKVTVTNSGAETWTPGGYYLAYRAYNMDSDAAVTQQRAADLPANVARGASVTLDATIKALPPGRYFLDFTMVRAGGPVFTDEQVPPGRIVLEVFDVPPVVQELHPPNGYQAPTLTPQLWARAVDIDAPAGTSLRFAFEYCERDDDGDNVNCEESGELTSQAWTVPAGALRWSRTYVWRATVKDANNEVTSDWSALLTSVPQPEITSRIAAAPYGSQDREFDPQTGNFSTAALDVAVTTPGSPDLRVVRTYNSLDPRRDLAFGAGWTSLLDVRMVPDTDWTGNVVVTYPDGQQVRFGQNPDGTFAAPDGRAATLVRDGTRFVLTDRTGMKYEFDGGNGWLLRIADAANRSLVVTRDGPVRVARIQVNNGQNNQQGRSLRFGWSGDHVTSVTTDAVGGRELMWTYAYSDDRLVRVCAPGDVCTSYEYGAGSHYRTAVLDSRPESYWRLGEPAVAPNPAGPTVGSVASEISVNLGKDAGTTTNVAFGADGTAPGSGDTAATFNGLDSALELPKGALKKNRDASVEMWFRLSRVESGGPLLAYQDAVLGAEGADSHPILYVGVDGLLRGQFRTGEIAPISSRSVVRDDKWHHVVLTADGDTQTLYLDGVSMGTLTGRIEHTGLTFNQVGAGQVAAVQDWPAWGPTTRRSFGGSVDEVAVYAHPLGAGTVANHHLLGSTAADQLTRVALPSGKTAVQASYDVARDRIAEYVDRNGGTWRIGPPAVYGSDTDLRRSVELRDPADRPWLYEYDALAGRMLRSGTPTGLAVREEDKPGWTPGDNQPPEPVERCSEPDSNDSRFCTIIPSTAGGPVFVRYAADGIAIRSFEYDERGFQTVVRNENDQTVTLGYDDRGNVTSRRTCREGNQCHTTYQTYPATGDYPATDPRLDLPVETRDGRSASAADNAYRTSFTYNEFGDLLSQTNPDGATVRHTYTGRLETNADNEVMPRGLLETTTDPIGGVTRYAYRANGDLTSVTEASGLVTRFSYDELGRRVSETEVSDAYPDGVTTTYAYDALSRVTRVTGPVTTDTVDGTRHQLVVSHEYDADGNVIRTEERDALADDPPRVTAFEYDDHNRLIRVVDPEGNETSYGYDHFGNRTSMVDAGGNHFEYAFTARNMIAEVRLRDWRGDPDGAPDPAPGDYLVLNSYAYDHAGRMVRHTDAMGHRLRHTYYNDDLPRQIILENYRNPDGGTRQYVVESTSYDAAGNVIRQEAADGDVVNTHTVDAVGRVTQTRLDPGGTDRITAFEYDRAGNVIETTSFGDADNVPWQTLDTGQTIQYTYDQAGQLVAEAVVASSTNRQVTRYTVDQRGLTTGVTDPRGTASGADAADYTTAIRYDELGRQIATVAPEVTVENSGAAPGRTTPTLTVGYNAYGEPVAERDELGNVSRREYDRLGQVVTDTAPTYTQTGGVQASPVSRYRYDALGNLTEQTDPRGGVTRHGYDQLNRLTARDEPASDNDERAVWRYTYTRTGEVLSVTDPTGARVETTYDDLDRPVTVTRLERRPVAEKHTTRYAYDDAGNLTAATSPTGARHQMTYNAAGELLRSTDPAGVVTQYGYDLHGRQVRMSDGLGRTSRIDYDDFGRVAAEFDQAAPDRSTLRSIRYAYDDAGNLISSTDAQGRVTTYQHDARNLLVRQVEPVSADRNITTSFGYDAVGNRTRYTDGRGNDTFYTVNSLNLPESVIEPATEAHPGAADRTWTMSYDLAGNPVRLRAPGDVVRQRSYDTGGRLVAESGGGGGTGEVSRRFGYDLAGRLTSSQAPGGADTFAYNDRGDLLSSAGPSGAASFTYDADGQLTGRTDAAGTARFTYADGRLSTVAEGVTATPQSLRYDDAGQLASVDYGSDRVRTFTYDNLGRPATDKLVNGAGQTVSSIAYSFDLDDRMTGKSTTGTAGAAENTYGYDFAGRLTSWNDGEDSTGYAWDDSGNRIAAGDKTATFDERNRLLTDGDYSYEYTPRGTLAGRTSSGLTEEYSFDAFDRLVGAEGQQYAYDSLDRLTARNGTGFAYAGTSGEVVDDGTGRYARGPGDELLATAAGDRQRLAVTDEHGDVVGGFDPADTALPALADSTGYDPFGQRTATAGEAGGPGANLGFQGDWTDPDTAQVNMGTRWYDPATGAFDSRDTVTYASGPSILANRYTYAAGDPLDHTDPDGRWPSCGWCSRAVNKVASVASTAASYAVSAARTTWNYTVSAVKYVASKVASAAKWVYNKAKSAVKWVASKVASAARWVASKAAAAVSWAKQKAAAMKRAAIAAAHKVTNAAKAAVKYAVKHNPLPVLKAALKPIYSGLKSVVSTAASLPAKVVSTVRDVVHDVAKAVDAVYQQAVAAAGTVVQAVSTAAAAVSEFVSENAATIAGIAAGAVVGIGCGVAIGWTGVGAVACGALAGAVGSVVHDLVEGGHSWKEMAGNALFGGVVGGLTGGLGSVAGAAIGSGVRAVSGGAGAALRSAGSAARGEVSNIASGRVGGAVGRARAGCNSFAPGTAVLMADGSTKPIERVRVGDAVLATDPTTGRTGPREVTDEISGYGEKKLVKITVDVDGEAGERTGTLVATGGHPFWVPDLGEWVDAGELRAGSMLRTSAGTYVQVTAVEQWTAKHQHAHNLTVDGLHTYYVVTAETSVLVHNCGTDGETIQWPPNNGFHGAPKVTVLKPGTLVDRFGYEGGRFVAPNGTPITGRALAPGTTQKPYSVYEVTNRLVAQAGPAEPWFGEVGMGTQYYLPASVRDLIDAGYMRQVG